MSKFSFDESAIDQRKLRIAICGAGFSGALFARQLEKLPNVEVVIFDCRKPNDFKTHWTQPLSGAGLNLNPNAIATLKEFDTDMYERLLSVGYVRKNVRFAMFDEENRTTSTTCAVAAEQRKRAVRIEDIVQQGLADSYGLCCRWDDANRTVQSALKKTEIQWGRKVSGYRISEDGKSVFPIVNNLFVDASTAVASTNASTAAAAVAVEDHGWFNLLVGCDGRYSDIRKQSEKNDIPVDFEDVCNFRILVPATEKEKGLFNVDDLTLVYNIPFIPTTADDDEVVASDSVATVDQADGEMKGGTSSESDDEVSSTTATTASSTAATATAVDYSNVAFRGLARVGVVRCPPTQLLDEGSIYIFGNFAIEGKQTVTAATREKEFIRALFMPKKGAAALSPEGQFLHRVFEEEAEKMHWARFQHVPPKFYPGDEIKTTTAAATVDAAAVAAAVVGERYKPMQPVVFLGDAAHAFSPALGQGATTSIEDAYAAAKIFLPALRSLTSSEATVATSASVAASGDVILNTIEKFADYRRERIEFIVDISTRAGLHLLPGAPAERLDAEIAGWMDDTAGDWRNAVRRMWKGYPRREDDLSAAVTTAL